MRRQLSRSQSLDSSHGSSLLPFAALVLVLFSANLTAVHWLSTRHRADTAPDSSVSARGGSRRYNTSAGRQDGKLNVHIVAHTHDDPGWLKTADQYFYGVRNDYHGFGTQASGVQYALDTVVAALQRNPNRKFIYGEMYFFSKWWRQQDETVRRAVRRLLADGQLEFVNGGWVSHDEAIVHYADMIDQTTRGHRFLKEALGVVPRIGWQIDCFGHSATSAALLYGAAGYDALMFARMDSEDKEHRAQHHQLETVWRASPSYGVNADIWTYIFTDHYDNPPGFGMGELDKQPVTDHIIDDVGGTEPVNVKQRVDAFVAAAQAAARKVVGTDVMILMGHDFAYSNSFIFFKNLDKLIHYSNLDGRVNAFYSTPGRYAAAKAKYNTTWPLTVGDMFPYKDCPGCYWTGYYTSRSTTKRYARQASSFLAAARQLEALVGWRKQGPNTDSLEAAVALLQHHDAITGTDRAHVNSDYRVHLARGMAEAERAVSAALEQLIFGKRRPEAGHDSSATAASSSGGLGAAARSLLELGNSSASTGDGHSWATTGPQTARQLQQQQQQKAAAAGGRIAAADKRQQAGGIAAAQQLAAVLQVLTLQELEWFKKLPYQKQLRFAQLPRQKQVALLQQRGRQGSAGQADLDLLLQGPKPAAVTPKPTTPPFIPLVAAGARLQSSAPLDWRAPEQATTLRHCALLNVSVCQPTVELSEAGLGIRVVVYNSLAWQRSQPVRLPIAEGARWRVTTSDGTPVLSQMVPVNEATRTLQRQLAAHGAASWSHAAPQELLFFAQAPPVGYAIYHAEPVRQTGVPAEHLAVASIDCTAPASSAAPNCSLSGNTAIASNEWLEARFSMPSGQLVHMANHVGGVRADLQARLVYYTSGMHPKHPPWVVRPSGPYVFHPFTNGTDVLSEGSAGQVAIWAGPLVTEVHQPMSKWATLVTRLYRDAQHLEFEWIVGPLEVTAKDVCLRVDSSVQSGDVFYTDSNGRDMMRRQRGFRQHFALRHIDSFNVSNPISSNYYPITTAAYVQDATSGAQLALLTERGQGATSAASGQLEVMLHRSSQHSDELGMPEPLNELAFNRGMIAKGIHWLTLQPATSAAKQRRHLQQLLTWPFMLTFAPFIGAQVATEKVAPHLSMLAQPLPRNVHLLTLASTPEGALIVRLAHLYEVQEDQSAEQLSQPATVDLSSLFSSFAITSVQETSLTTNQLRSEMGRATHRAGDPFYNIAPQQNIGEVPLPVGFNSLGAYQPAIDDVYHARTGFPSPPLHQQGSLRSSVHANLVVQLVPMEIRTFRLTVRLLSQQR